MTYDTVTGNGTVTGDGVSTTFYGIENLSISGSFFSDKLVGGNGNDTLYGGNGNDTLDGGAGNDFLQGGDGNSYFSLDGNGRDFVYGDIISGILGLDTLSVSYRRATSGVVMTYDTVSDNGKVIGSGVSTKFYGIESFNVVGSNFADTLVGGANKDFLIGNQGNDIINSGAGNDYLNGGRNNDILNGEAGNDSLYGGSGNDALNGGDGNDVLVGVGTAVFGLGTIDTLTGSAGSDTFSLASVSTAFYDDGNNAAAGLSDYALITDFDVSTDKIQLKSGLSYVLGTVPGCLGIGGTGIFIDNDGVAGLSAKDELVSVLQGVTLTPGAITTTTGGFIFL